MVFTSYVRHRDLAVAKTFADGTGGRIVEIT